jgi:hypothetical protein
VEEAGAGPPLAQLSARRPSPKRIVKAFAPDWFGHDFVPSGLTEDRYIKAIETKPSAGSREVVHHLLTYDAAHRTCRARSARLPSSTSSSHRSHAAGEVGA